MTFSADSIPAGLTLDAVSGRISGTLQFPGEHRVTLTATNSLGSATRSLTIVVGETDRAHAAVWVEQLELLGRRR